MLTENARQITVSIHDSAYEALEQADLIYADRSLNTNCLAWGRIWLGVGVRKLPEVIEMFCSLQGHG